MTRFRRLLPLAAALPLALACVVVAPPGPGVACGGLEIGWTPGEVGRVF